MIYYAPNFYKQYDKQWGSYSRGGYSIAAQGCGPTCIANVISSLGALKNTQVTPVTVTDWLYNNGHFVSGGTTNSGIKAGLEHFGIRNVTYTRSDDTAAKAIKRGDWVIALVGPGEPNWTFVGHFIVAFRPPDGKSKWISDPNHNGPAQEVTATLSMLANCGCDYWIIENTASYLPNGGSVTPSQYGGTPITVNWTDLDANIVVVNRKSPNINLAKFPRVAGLMIEAGSLFSKTHKKYETFRNPKAYEQAESAIAANKPFGYYMPIRARNTVEAEEEMYELSFLVRKYPPKLGVWLDIQLGGSKPFKDNMLKTYQKELIRLGLKSKIGISTTHAGLNSFSWKKFQDDWWLWLVDKVKTMDEVNNLLTPEFFDTDGKSG